MIRRLRVFGVVPRTRGCSYSVAGGYRDSERYISRRLNPMGDLELVYDGRVVLRQCSLRTSQLSNGRRFQQSHASPHERGSERGRILLKVSASSFAQMQFIRDVPILNTRDVLDQHESWNDTLTTNRRGVCCDSHISCCPRLSPPSCRGYGPMP